MLPPFRKRGRGMGGLFGRLPGNRLSGGRWPLPSAVDAVKVSVCCDFPQHDPSNGIAPGGGRKRHQSTEE